VPREIDSEVIERQINLSPMRRLATVRQTRANSVHLLASIGGARRPGWASGKAGRRLTSTSTQR
jgi:HK97 family phage major capsid protein